MSGLLGESHGHCMSRVHMCVLVFFSSFIFLYLEIGERRRTRS